MLTENIQSREEGVNLKEIDVELKKQKSAQVCLIYSTNIKWRFP